MKDVVKIAFGKLENGRDVSLYRITNDMGASVTICDYGALIQSICVPDKDGILRDVVLGFDELSSYIYDEAYLGACVGRYANRLRGNKLYLNGLEHSLEVNEGQNVLHGGEQGFNKVFYQVEKKDRSTILFHYKSKDGEGGFPGTLNFSVAYKFNEDNELAITYFAESDKDTVVNFTNHSYFNLNGHGSACLDNHSIVVNSLFYTPTDCEMIPTGEIRTCLNTSLDLSREQVLNEVLEKLNNEGKSGLDHNYIISRNKIDGNCSCGYNCDLSFAARVKSSESGILLEVYTTEPAVQVYTANALAVKKGKNESEYKRHSAFCLETQHYPNSPEFSHFPTTALCANEKYKSQTIFKFKKFM